MIYLLLIAFHTEGVVTHLACIRLYSLGHTQKSKITNGTCQNWYITCFSNVQLMHSKI